MPDTDYDFVVCVYCDRTHPMGTVVCKPCGEYKGIMTVEAWEDYLGLSWYGEMEDDEPVGMTDVEADADTLASAGWGTDEDYGYYGGDEYE